ncbi:MAG: class I fructose-bisphosphate aldolase [Alphaproteobacteria bacterium]
MPHTIDSILAHYESDSAATRANLAKLLSHGKLGGSGKLIVLAVDQGFEHGPSRSFAVNHAAYDPHYHFQLAIDAGLSGFAAPLGLLESGAKTFADKIPTILKMNSGNSLVAGEPNQAITACVDDAVRLGCSGIGFTIYPGSDHTYEMIEKMKDLIAEAKSKGLFVIIWSYPRGNMSSAGETGLDVVSYGAHMACLLGAHIVKVKIPTDHLEKEVDRQALIAGKIPYKTLEDRIEYVVKSCFAGRRMVIFSGGAKKTDKELLEEVHDVKKGGGFGSIIGRNLFQRPRQEALSLIDEMIRIYKGK